MASTVLGQGLNILIEIGPIMVLSRLLSPNDFGVMAIAASIAGILAAMKEAGLSAATVQAPKITHEQVTALFWVNVLLGGGVGALSLAVGPVAAWWMKQPLLTWIIPSLGAIGLMDCFGIQHDALLQRKLQFRQLVTRQLVARACGVAVGIVAASYGAGIWSLVLMLAFSALAGTITLWRACAWRPGPFGNLRVAYPMMSFGFKILLERVLGQSARGLDALVIGYYHGSATTGMYSRAQGILANPLAKVMAPIMNVARPALSRAAESHSRFRRAITEALGIISFAAAGAVAVLVPASEGIIRLLLGPKWLDAVPIFSILSCFALVEPCASIMASAVVAVGKPGALLKWRLFSIVTVIVGLLLAAPYGVLAIAAAYAVMGLVVRMPLFFWYAAPHVGIPFWELFEPVLPATIGSIISIAGTTALRPLLHDPGSLIGTLQTVLIATVFYASLCLLFPRTRKVIWSLWENVQTVANRRPAAQPTE